jgi:hypothetical protein
LFKYIFIYDILPHPPIEIYEFFFSLSSSSFADICSVEFFILFWRGESEDEDKKEAGKTSLQISYSFLSLS